MAKDLIEMPDKSPGIIGKPLRDLIASMGPALNLENLMSDA